MVMLLAVLGYCAGLSRAAGETVVCDEALSSTTCRRLQDVFKILQTSRVADSMGSVLETLGYFDYKILKRNDSIFVTSGPQYRIGQVAITTIPYDGVIETDTSNNFDRPAGQEQINAIRTELLEQWWDDGYYFASLSLDRASLDSLRLNLAFRLITGTQVGVDQVRFKGAGRMNRTFLARLAGVQSGDSLSPGLLASTVDNLEKGGYLAVDSGPRVIPTPDYQAAQLVYYLSEYKSNQVQFGGGYVPEQGNQSGGFVGRILFESANLFGSGRKIRLLYDRKDRFSSLVEFSYAQPFFIPSHVEAAFTVSQQDYDSSYNEFELGIDISLLSRRDTRFSAGAQWHRVDPQLASQNRVTRLMATVGYLTSSLKEPVNPRSGYTTSLRAAFIHRVSESGRDGTENIDDESSFEIDGHAYVPLLPRLVFHLHGHAKILLTDRDLPDLSELYKLGGHNSLRGYTENRFAGQRIALGQIELRLRPSREFAMYPFFDIGYVYGRQSAGDDPLETIDDIFLASGFGLFAGSRSASAKIEFGWGEGDSFNDGKVHVTLITRF